MGEEIKKLIQESGLSEEDRQIWLNALQSAPSEIISALSDYLLEFPDKLSWLTDILKRKMEAMKKKDEGAWNQILAEEALEIKKIIEE